MTATIEQKGEDIILHPVKTREDFIAELEKSLEDWEKNGGITLTELL